MDHSETKSLIATHEPAKLDDASTLLLKAAALIEEHGWCQNSLYTDDGHMCLVGALHYASRGEPTTPGGDWHPTTLAAYDRFCSYMDLRTDGGPARWNDDHGRTKEQVVAKLRAVALSS